MKIYTLIENTTSSNDLLIEHGLSLYIETEKHKILFDTGMSNAFSLNAIKLGLDLSLVDILIISHGHYDHGGGLSTFLEINKTAKIYLNKNVFLDYYSKRSDTDMHYIGLDKNLMNNNRFTYIDEYYKIDDELQLFSKVSGNMLIPTGNRSLYKLVNNEYVNDDFIHEQNLIIKENNIYTLIAGCAHRGIINIMNHFKTIDFDYVIGGFHLYNRNKDLSESIENINTLAKLLLEYKAMFYTCHCTGIVPFNILKTIMKDRIRYLETGSKITIESKHLTLAKSYFKAGYNCAQSVVAAFSDETGLDLIQSLKISSSFGGGMGRLREVCGAVSGIFMVLGSIYGYSEIDSELKEKHYKLVIDSAAKFKKENNSIICRELLEMNIISCSKLVENAVNILDEILICKKSDIPNL